MTLGRINSHTIKKLDAGESNGVNPLKVGIHTILFVLRKKSSGVDSGKEDFHTMQP